MTTTIVDDDDARATLTRAHTYDTLGRPGSTTYPTWSADDDAVTVDYVYDKGYLTTLNSGGMNLVSVTAQTAYGQAKTSVHGNGAKVGEVAYELSYDTSGHITTYVSARRRGRGRAGRRGQAQRAVVLGHDPYGGRHQADWAAQLTSAATQTLLGEHGRRVSRGVTGHEHLDRTGLVHMNGRVYDPRLGRFLRVRT